MRLKLIVASAVCGVMMVGCIQTSSERVRALELFGQGRSVKAYDVATDRILFDLAGVVRDLAVAPTAVRVAVRELLLQHRAVWVEDKPSSELVLATFPVVHFLHSSGRDIAVAIRIEKRESHGSRVTVLVQPVNRWGKYSVEKSANEIHEELLALLTGTTK